MNMLLSVKLSKKIILLLKNNEKEKECDIGKDCDIVSNKKCPIVNDIDNECDITSDIDCDIPPTSVPRH